jgi:hypothetical protein
VVRLPDSVPRFPLRSSPRLLGGVGAVLVLVVIAVVVILVSSGSGGPPVAHLPPAVQRTGPETIFTAGAQLKTDPEGTLNTLQQLGVERVRVFVTWGQVAPDSGATHEPAGFDAADPAAYPQAGWTLYDTLVRDVLAHHMGLDMVLGPSPPRWASGKGAPDPANHTYWKPSAPDFEQFAQSVGIRYSGHYLPPGASRPLPRVAFWSLWNEPNLGVQLAPQALPHSTVEESALLYRKLADAAWEGLRASGHSHDTILIGELAPAGATFPGAPGDFAAMAPLRFLRALYCVGSDYRPLIGAAATARGCPATASGSAQFAGAHPVLFHASGFAAHPYPQGLPPDESTPGEPDFAELAAMPKLLRVLDTLQQAYGSHKRFPVFSTEFGYQTTPPDTEGGTVSPTLAAEYINWSEYITWSNPRLASYDQYLLLDPPPAGGAYTGFATGLSTYNGQRKPTYDAFRMPLFLPVTRTATGHPLEVWGCVRPAHQAARTSHRPQSVHIQFQRASGGAFSTVQTVKLTDPDGYFDVRATFPGRGSVRLTWTYPHGQTIHSRTVAVTVG